jgi:hypothetical protein
MSEDAKIVATLALAIRRSNNSARSHPQLGYSKKVPESRYKFTAFNIFIFAILPLVGKLFRILAQK